jgi:hypothetical protein
MRHELGLHGNDVHKYFPREPGRYRGGKDTELRDLIPQNLDLVSQFLYLPLAFLEDRSELKLLVSHGTLFPCEAVAFERVLLRGRQCLHISAVFIDGAIFAVRTIIRSGTGEPLRELARTSTRSARRM